MYRAITVLSYCLILLLLDSVGSPTQAEGVVDFGMFNIEFVEIGDPGNEPDFVRLLGVPDSVEVTAPRDGAYWVLPTGAVDYQFNIAKTEVSRAAYETVFRDAPTSPVIDPKTDEITESFGEPWPDMPAMGLNWFEAALFTNWLNESKEYPPAYKFDVLEESGNTFYLFRHWEIGDDGFDPENPIRNAGAKSVSGGSSTIR